MGKLLHLNLKGEYFDQIKAKTKTEEFRLYNDYWKKRLIGPAGKRRHFDGILIKRGYPKKDDPGRILKREWQGWTLKEIIHPEFGINPVKVFAIKVN